MANADFHIEGSKILPDETAGISEGVDSTVGELRDAMDFVEEVRREQAFLNFFGFDATARHFIKNLEL
jgi:hypothetical protein